MEVHNDLILINIVIALLDELKTFLDRAFKLEYDEEPDYNKLRALCRTVLKREGIKEGSVFDFGSQSPADAVPNGSPVQSKKRKAASKEREPVPKGKMAKADKPGPSGAASPRAPPKKRTASAKESGKTAEYYELKQGKFDTRFSIKNDPIID